MSLYIIEDDDGNVLTNDGDFDNNIVYAALYDEPLEPAKDIERYGGHVVTLTEEPKKVVLTKEQAEIVEEAHDSNYPASYIAGSSDDEKLIMNAYVNGYTVAKEKKYLVYKALGGKHTADVQYAQAYLTSVHSKILWILTSWILTGEDTDESFFQFTESEIEHYGLQDCEKVEVTGDEQ